MLINLFYLYYFILMRTNLLSKKNSLILENQKLHQSSGDFDQKQNQQGLIKSNVKPFSTSKISKEGIHFSYFSPAGTKEVHTAQMYSAPKRIITREKSENSRVSSSRIANEQIVKGESSIKYVPYERKIVQYQDRSVVEKVPVKKKVVKYEEKKVMQAVPRERVEQNYYAVQTRVQYLKEFITQKRIQMVPVQRKIKRQEYLPVERKIVRYPCHLDGVTVQEESKELLKNHIVPPTAPDEFDIKINTNLVYTYSTRRGARDTYVGSGDQKQSRLISQNVIPPSPKVQSKPLNIFKNDEYQPPLLSPQSMNIPKNIIQHKSTQFVVQSSSNVNDQNKQKSVEVEQIISCQKSQLESKYRLNKVQSLTTYVRVQKQVADSIIVEDEKKSDQK